MNIFNVLILLSLLLFLLLLSNKSGQCKEKVSSWKKKSKTCIKTEKQSIYCWRVFEGEFGVKITFKVLIIAKLCFNKHCICTVYLCIPLKNYVNIS